MDYDKIFINCLIKKWKNLSRTETSDLKKRKVQLNNQFVFTTDAILKLREINGKLYQQEIEILNQIKRMYLFCDESVEKGLIEYYDFEIEFHCWNGGYYNEWDNLSGANPFYSNYILTPSFFEADYKINQNEYAGCPEHPLAEEFHCCLFHHLYDHTPLAWKDILLITEIGFNLKIVNQIHCCITDPRC